MVRGRSTEPWWRVLEVYYLATPLFFLVDLVWQAPIRVAGIESQSWRYAYYAALVAFVILGRARPALRPLIGLTESSINLLLLILSIMLPIWGMADLVFTDQPVPPLFPPAKLWNFVLVAPMVVISIKLNEHALFSWARRSDMTD